MSYEKYYNTNTIRSRVSIPHDYLITSHILKGTEMKHSRHDICLEIISLENELEALIEINASKTIIKQKKERISRLKSNLKRRKDQEKN